MFSFSSFLLIFFFSFTVYLVSCMIVLFIKKKEDFVDCIARLTIYLSLAYIIVGHAQGSVH